MKSSSIAPGISGPALKTRIWKNRTYYLFLLPGVVYLILFHYFPMLGLRWSFFEYDLRGVGDFVGLGHFRDAFSSEGFRRAFRNTLLLSSINIAIQMTLTLTIALLLNEVRLKGVKKAVQTVIYLPHFLSWVVVAALFTLLLSRQGGLVNGLITAVGGEPVYFLGNPATWRPVYLFILAWREVGWGTVIFLAALSGVDPELYEAAWIDGAGRWKQMRFITIPHLAPVIVIVLIMNLAKIFNLFESVFVLYNPLVYSVSDVIQTYVYRSGLGEFRFGYSTAVGLFRSTIAFALVVTANSTVKRIRGESAF